MGHGWDILGRLGWRCRSSLGAVWVRGFRCVARACAIRGTALSPRPPRPTTERGAPPTMSAAASPDGAGSPSQLGPASPPAGMPFGEAASSRDRARSHRGSGPLPTGRCGGLAGRSRLPQTRPGSRAVRQADLHRPGQPRGAAPTRASRWSRAGSAAAHRGAEPPPTDDGALPAAGRCGGLAGRRRLPQHSAPLPGCPQARSGGAGRPAVCPARATPPQVPTPRPCHLTSSRQPPPPRRHHRHHCAIPANRSGK